MVILCRKEICNMSLKPVLYSVLFMCTVAWLHLEHGLLVSERLLQQLHGPHALGVVPLEKLVIMGLGAQLLQHQGRLLLHLLHLVLQEVHLQTENNKFLILSLEMAMFEAAFNLTR